MNTIDWSTVGFSTLAVHGGQDPDPTHGALATPIYQTSTFCFDTREDGTAIFLGEKPGFAYSRGGNPTVRALETKIALLEGGEECIATASGMGAISSVLLTLLSSGDHVVMGNCVYGCTNVVIQEVLPKFGITMTAVDTNDLAAVEAAIQDNTKILYFETVSNPMTRVADIEALSALAKAHGVKVIVDSTFAPTPLVRPLALGADIVVHSATKYLNGHGDVIAGLIVGKKEDLAPIRTYGSTKACGSTLSPHDAFLVLRGLQTLGLRMDRHCSNAMKVAQFLETCPQIETVLYPGLESHPDHDIAVKQFKKDMFTGILSFEMKDGINGMTSLEAGTRVVNALTIPHIAVSLGDPSSLVEHPATMTHRNVPPQERVRMGISDGLIRFSVGLEDPEDLIADLQQALATLD
ncbi:trans-sulfuration enzyme family protein [Slackia heliotrinireducens]|uniref:trans-sulfuration enzyme family protein n=1 Tax=Slackia heliotrinireducens TaxID=84110 RepID=UPI0033145AF9